MQENIRLSLPFSEYNLAQLVWKNEPINSGDLAALSLGELGWKKSTTYTVLKKLCDKEVLCNDNAIVSSLVDKSAVQRYESRQIVSNKFGGSLRHFVAAFMDDNPISQEEVLELKKLIDSYKEG